MAQPASAPPVHPIPEGRKSFIVTLLLALFIGFFGADRFYLGKTQSGVAKLVTFGGFGYWWLIDVFLTLIGRQRDVWGLRLEGYDKYKNQVWFVIAAILGSALLIGAIAATLIAGFDSSGPTTFGWALLGVFGVAAVGGSTVWILRHRRAHGTQANATHQSDPLPYRIRSHVDALTALRRMYVLHAAAGSQSAEVMIGQVDSLKFNLTELFERMKAKSGRAQQRRAEQEYDNLLNTLVGALGRDYLLDVFANARLWDNPERRIRVVQAAVQAVDGQLLDNIRQVNSRRELTFEVTLDGIEDRH